MVENILRRLLAQEPLVSTWYYQDKRIAALEYSIIQALAADPYSDWEETEQLLRKKGWVFAPETIRKQMHFMSLYEKEERLIFFALLRELTAALIFTDKTEQSGRVHDVLHAVALEETADGRIKSFADNFIYLPKCALAALLESGKLFLPAEEKEKFYLSKPKFAKYCLNELLFRNEAEENMDSSFMLSVSKN